MGISVFLNGQEFKQVVYDEEVKFEELIGSNSEMLFKNRSIYIDVKQRIGTGSLGRAIPDGILLDLADTDSPEFYLVEVELERHDFYRHLFPQVTKSYIGVSDRKNIAFLLFRSEKIVMVVLMPEDEVREILQSKHHVIRSHSESAQRAWGGNNPNCSVVLRDSEYFQDVENLLGRLVSGGEEL